jgi:hypothetical protein
VPLAVLQGEKVIFLSSVAPDQQWRLQQILQRRHYPARLRSYLGR